MDCTNYSISKIGKLVGKEFLSKHDPMTQDGASYCNGHSYALRDKDDQIVGVAVFHMVSAWETVRGCFALEDKEQKSFWELGRLVMDNEHDTDEWKSWFLTRCIERFTTAVSVRALFAYVNSERETGSYLPPAGFKYCGLTAQRTDFYIKQADGSYKKQSRGKTKGVDGEWRPRPRKHRYLIVYDDSLTPKWEEQTNPHNI